MKKIIITLCIGSLLTFSCKNSVQDQKKEISETSQKSDFQYSAKSALKYLTSDELNGRDTGSEGIDKAAIYIENAFEKFEVEPYFETYRDSFKLKEADGFNVVGVLKAEESNDLTPLVIGAHYDHVGIIEAVEKDSIANGANDNASGTVAVLELAKYLASQDLKRDVIFALFSAEEKGLVGSRHLATKMKSMEVEPYLVFNIEMLGVQMKDKNYRAYITGYEMSNLAEVFNGFYEDETEFLGFLPQAAQYGLFKRSDNYPFYETFGVPSHTICTFDFTNYEYYHHVNDEFEELDVEAYLKLVNDLKPGVLKLVNSTETTVNLN
ncbi:M20/M25/M40 family metallo-hydrolase [Psychroflexus sp. CAK57W]|uniref:M20/M25/M40 family metallo-hydrolase n=1 Tax=Psychroflexus curvus TaxID=2873595 RepID=UPI001CCCD25C|nr:M20/M25/M40 family metallo-hydrolase [Psychroflexus curvus]MBZ9629048.1 M20/M25/M40 family metallo-hydrolase [Psychroflexus curvus]MBZ9788443.1 M20/M25/M40 family metallo-hydrolase [Psychroflexus curvus]